MDEVFGGNETAVLPEYTVRNPTADVSQQRATIPPRTALIYPHSHIAYPVTDEGHGIIREAGQKDLAFGLPRHGITIAVDYLDIVPPWSNPEPLVSRTLAGYVSHFPAPVAVEHPAFEDLRDLLAHKGIQRPGGSDHRHLRKHFQALAFRELRQLVLKDHPAPMSVLCELCK